jgi:hypothetical protein
LSLSAQPALAADGATLLAAKRRQSWGLLGVFAGAVMLAVLLVIVVSRKLPAPSEPQFDDRPLTRLKLDRPEFLLLGNSMVGTRFDEHRLRHLLRPHRVSVIGSNGAKSAVWYLTLKNIVVASGLQPRLIQFFREQELTEPSTYATTTRGQEMIQLLSVGSEPLVARKIAPPLSQPIAHFEWYRKRVVPLERFREEIQPLLDHVAELGSQLMWRNANRHTRRREINDLFSLSNLRGSEVVREPAAPDEAQVFANVVGQSFLPDVCELAKKSGIPLTFVRVRTRAAASGASKRADEQRYDTDLEQYIRACPAEFYDMRDEAWESIDMYGSGDHIAGPFKRRYTDLFVEHMANIFH